jgi:transposase
MSNFQLLPYKRIEEHFADQFGIPLSAGSIYNFRPPDLEDSDVTPGSRNPGSADVSHGG